MPVAFALMAGVIVGTMLTPTTLMSMIRQLFNGIDSEALMAIPFFLLVGELMTSARVIERIVDLVAGAGRPHARRPGPGRANGIPTCSSPACPARSSADVAVLTKTMARPMAKQGYDPAFVASLIAAASTIAALVPPSIMAVVYGAVGNVSIAGLFLGGVLPGILIGVGLMIYSYFFGPVGHRQPRATFRQLTAATGHAGLALLIPVILLGGVLTGWFTPTEAGVVAVAYILVVVIPILNRKHMRMLPRDFVHAGLVFTLPVITIAAASAFGWMLAYLRGPIVVSEWITSMGGTDPYKIMFLLVALFVIVGDFIEPIPAIVIFMPVVNALTQAGGINSVHMGVVLIITLAFGLITPPPAWPC